VTSVLALQVKHSEKSSSTKFSI